MEWLINRLKETIIVILSMITVVIPGAIITFGCHELVYNGFPVMLIGTVNIFIVVFWIISWCKLMEKIQINPELF